MEKERGRGKSPGNTASRAISHCLTFVVASLLLISSTRTTTAQVSRAGPDERAVPNWVGQFTILGANGLLGGVTAGIAQELRGGSFTDGFTRGFLGGSIVYAGKRVAVEHFAGAGLLGRTVAAAGASAVRNASDGRPSFDSLILPFGPVRFYVDRGSEPGLRVKLDLNSLVMTGAALSQRELHFSFGSSLSAGTAVFTAREHLFGSVADTIRASGEMHGNVIFLSELPWRSDHLERELFAHERVHVLQRDQFFATITEPLAAEFVHRAGTRAFPVLPLFYRYVDIDLSGLLFQALSVPFSDYYDRPWEMEAYHLMGR